MKLRPVDIVWMIIGVAVMAYIFSGIASTWYPGVTAEEVEKQYLQQQKEAKVWPQD